jgi:hypothetical protein
MIEAMHVARRMADAMRATGRRSWGPWSPDVADVP